MNNLTDEQLVEAYLHGDNQSLEFLIQRHLNQVYGFVYGYVNNQADAEDITQETFVKAWKKIKKFKPEYKFKTWLFTIAKNTALDFLKKKQPVPFSAMAEKSDDDNDFSFADGLVDARPMASEVINKEIDYQDLNEAIETLPENYRATLALRYNEGLKFREIANITKESIDTIKTRNRRVLESLRKLLTK